MEKEKEALRMQAKLIEHVAEFEREEIEGQPESDEYQTAAEIRETWKVLLGDSAERLGELADNSVDFSVFSPPFESLGNSASTEEFWQHFHYIVKELLRVVKPGRNVAVHCMAIPTTIARDGVTGVRDFRGDIIRGFVADGWTFHGEVTIDKDPQAQAIRTKSKGLLFVQALADYIVIFRKPGDNAVPIRSDEVGTTHLVRHP